MDASTQIKQDSAKHFLTRLSLAIHEAKLVRLTVKSNILAARLEPSETVNRRLMLVNREIELLESKLVKIRCPVNRG